MVLVTKATGSQSQSNLPFTDLNNAFFQLLWVPKETCGEGGLTELFLALEEVSNELIVCKDELKDGLHVTVVQLVDDGSAQVLRTPTRYLTWTLQKEYV